MPDRAALVVQIAILETSTIRGLDYLNGEPAGTLARVEAAMPLPVWGALFLLGAALGALGLIFGRRVLVGVGHSLLAGLYAAVGTGIILQTGFGDGIRTGNGLLVGGLVIHLAYVWGAATARDEL